MKKEIENSEKILWLFSDNTFEYLSTTIGYLDNSINVTKEALGKEFINILYHKEEIVNVLMADNYIYDNFNKQKILRYDCNSVQKKLKEISPVFGSLEQSSNDLSDKPIEICNRAYKLAGYLRSYIKLY